MQMLRGAERAGRTACAPARVAAECHTDIRMLTTVLAGIILLGSTQLDATQRARLERLENALLAPCCYQEVVATHASEAAKQMRAELAELVAAGWSDREILDHYKRRYGARVLAEPEGAQWWVMNVVPMVMLAGGAALVVLLVRKWRRGAVSGAA